MSSRLDDLEAAGATERTLLALMDVIEVLVDTIVAEQELTVEFNQLVRRTFNEHRAGLLREAIE